MIGLLDVSRLNEHLVLSKVLNLINRRIKKVTKWITLVILFLTLITHLHIPLHRHLIDDIDTDEQRSWCLARCSSSMNIFNPFITLAHFFIPFSINLLSIVFVIILIAHSRFTLQPRLTYKQHLELHLMASYTLVLLALSRLIISFIRGMYEITE
ncbi:unnamed protein product [Rotaria socialis]